MDIPKKPALLAIVTLLILTTDAANAELVVTRLQPDRFVAGAQDEFSVCLVNGYLDDMRLGIVQVNSQYSQRVVLESVSAGEEKCLPVKLDGSAVNVTGLASLRFRVERLDKHDHVGFDYLDSPVVVVESGWKLLLVASSIAFVFFFVISSPDKKAGKRKYNGKRI